MRRKCLTDRQKPNLNRVLTLNYIRLYCCNLIFVTMKKGISTYSFVFTVAVLVSMLFQSLHKYEHIAQQLPDIHCVHKKTAAGEITHQHHYLDFCGTCDFKVSHFVVFGFATTTSVLTFNYSNPSVFSTDKLTSFLKGSQLSLRGPPFV